MGRLDSRVTSLESEGLIRYKTGVKKEQRTTTSSGVKNGCLSPLGEGSLPLETGDYNAPEDVHESSIRQQQQQKQQQLFQPQASRSSPSTSSVPSPHVPGDVDGVALSPTDEDGIEDLRCDDKCVDDTNADLVIGLYHPLEETPVKVRHFAKTLRHTFHSGFRVVNNDLNGVISCSFADEITF